MSTLPDDLWAHIVSFCDTKSRCCLAVTCQSLRRLTAECSDVALTGEDVKAGALPWLRTQTALSSLCIYKAVVPLSVFSMFTVPRRLESLVIHCLKRTSTDIFTLRFLTPCVHLHTVRLGFGRGWSMALVQHAVNSWKYLRTFELKGIPTIIVSTPIPATHCVSLHALDILRVTTAARPLAAPKAQSVRLRCDFGSLKPGPFCSETVKHLRLRAPQMKQILEIPYVESMVNLETLNIQCRLFQVPGFGGLRHLRRLTMHARSCFLMDWHDSTFPPHTKLIADTGTPPKPIDLRRWVSGGG